MPAGERDQLADPHLNLHGDVGLSDRLCAHRVCDLMAGDGNRALVQHMRRGYERLLDAGALADHIAIEMGYFLFGEIREPHERFLCVYAPSFELDGQPQLRPRQRPQQCSARRAGRTP